MTKTNLVLALSAALVAGAAGVAGAAPIVKVSGSVGGNLNYQQKATGTVPGGDFVPSGVSGTNRVALNSEINAGDKVAARIVLKGMSNDALGQRDMPASTGHTYDFGVDRASLTTTGSWWNGAQAVTTTVGDFDAVYSPYVADNLTGEGIKVEGIKAGPMTLEGFYGLGATNNDGSAAPHTQVPLFGGKATAKVGGATVTGVGIREGSEIDGHGSIAVSPMKGFDVTGDYALSQKTAGADIDQAMMLTAKAAVSPNLTVRGSVRNFDSTFAPIYASYASDSSDFVHSNLGERGLHGGMDLKMGAVNTSLDWDGPDKYVEGKADTSLVGFKLTGRAKTTGLTYHDSTVTVARDLAVRGNKVTAMYQLDHTVDPLAVRAFTHAVTATYAAPNGFSVGAGWSSDKGYNANTGMSLSF